MIWLALACAQPQEAPPQMDEVTRALFTDWADADAMVENLDDLRVLTQDVDWTADDWQDRSQVVTAFGREHVEGLVDHDGDPAETFGIGLFHESPYTIEEHFQVIRLEDRTVLEDSAPNLYERTFVDGDPDCMLAGDCETMQSYNLVRRESFFHGEMTYELTKEFRWVETSAGPALAARSYQLEPSQERDNKVVLWQSYSLDIWMPDAAGSHRYHLSWQETELAGGLSDEDIDVILGGGIQGVLDGQDEWLDEQG